MVRTMCRKQLRDRTRVKELIQIFGLNVSIDHLTMANCNLWYVEGGWSCVENESNVEGQGKKER